MIEEYGQWIDYVADFASLIHTKYGYFVHYPFDGGLFDQPWRTMEIFKIMLAEYRKVLTEKQNKP